MLVVEITVQTPLFFTLETNPERRSLKPYDSGKCHPHSEAVFLPSVAFAQVLEDGPSDYSTSYS